MQVLQDLLAVPGPALASVFRWLDKHNGSVTAATTLALTGLTGLYVWLTWWMARATSQNLQQSSLPLISCSLAWFKEATYLNIENWGQGAAYDVEVWAIVGGKPRRRLLDAIRPQWGRLLVISDAEDESATLKIQYYSPLGDNYSQWYLFESDDAESLTVRNHGPQRPTVAEREEFQASRGHRRNGQKVEGFNVQHFHELLDSLTPGERATLGRVRDAGLSYRLERSPLEEPDAEAGK